MNVVSDFLANLSSTETIVAIVAGALLLLFGYRIKKIAFFIVWFLLGYTLMNNYLVPLLVENVPLPEIATSEVGRTLMPIIGGLLVALLGFSIEKICIGGICFALTMIITATYFGTDMQTLAIGAVIGVVMSGVGVFLMKPAIIVATSLAGAYAVTISILKLSGIDAELYYFPILIGLTVIGSGIQFITTKHEK